MSRVEFLQVGDPIGNSILIGVLRHLHIWLCSFTNVQIGIPGDINGDAVVDSTDLGILGGSWGSFKGDPNYNPDSDIDDTGVVDSSDLGIMGAHWGEFEP